MTAPGRQLTIDAIDVGWPVYSDQRRHAHTDNPVGGTVVEVIRQPRADPETGELSDVHLFRCLATWNPARPWWNLDAREIDLGQLYGLDRGACAAGVRWLVRQISQKRRGWLNSDELDALRYAWALARAAA